MSNSPEVNAYQHNADRTRGCIIYHTILLERIMDVIIARHFFATDVLKNHELKELLIADRMEFSKKAEVFMFLLAKECEFKKTDFNQTYPRIKQDFVEIGEDRNRFAHNLSLMPPTAELKNSEIVLLKWKNKAEHKVYTIDNINEIMQKLNKYINLFATNA